MQATPLWVTITGFVLGPAVVAAFLTYIFNKSLNKQKSSLDEVVQERLNEQKASLDKSVQSSLNKQKASLDEAVHRRLSEYAAARQEEHHRAERRRLLARRYLYQLGEAVDSLWYRVDNWANRGGARWSESRHPGYWEVTSLYVVARALGAERMLALEGVYVDLYELSSDKDPKLPERAVEEAVKTAFEPGGLSKTQFEEI